MAKLALNLLPIFNRLGASAPVFGAAPALQAHSLLQRLQNSFTHHPQVRQRKQHRQLADVFGQTLLAQLAMTEQALDDAKLLFGLGSNACLEFLQLLAQHIAHFALIHGSTDSDQAVTRLTFADHY